MRNKDIVARVINCLSFIVVDILGVYLTSICDGGADVLLTGIILMNATVQTTLFFYGKSTHPAIQFYIPIATTLFALMAQTSLLIYTTL